jgi:hypothetical protein
LKEDAADHRDRKERRERTKELAHDFGHAIMEKLFGRALRGEERDSKAGKPLPRIIDEGSDTLLAVIASGEFPKCRAQDDYRSSEVRA